MTKMCSRMSVCGEEEKFYQMSLIHSFLGFVHKPKNFSLPRSFITLSLYKPPYHDSFVKDFVMILCVVSFSCALHLK